MTIDVLGQIRAEQEGIYTTLLGGPDHGANAVLKLSDVRPFFVYSKIERFAGQGFNRIAGRYQIATTLGNALIEVERMEREQQKAWEAFNDHECDDGCHTWLDELQRTDKHVKEIRAIAEGYGYGPTAALYFWEAWEQSGGATS